MRNVLLLLVACLGGPGSGLTADIPPVPEKPFTIVVMDPLAAALACACVAGYAQRDYDQLGTFLEKQTGRSVTVRYAEELTGHADLVFGKYSVVRADAAHRGLSLRTVAMLSDTRGHFHQTGLFVVRARDPASGIGDLAGYRLLFGPDDALEKHGAARASLEAFDIPLPKPLRVSPGCSTASLAVIEKEADAAIISSYALPLLEGCGSIEKGELKVIGHTDPVPFITVFAAPSVDDTISRALLAANKEPDLLRALESRDGFRPLPPVWAGGAGWPDWRGRDRTAISGDVPLRLPARPHLLWSRIMTGHGMAGLSAFGGRVIVADKDLEARQDIFHSLDADTGQEIWRIEYSAAGDMDFTNSPRANPVVHGGRVFLLGAFGDLFCVDCTTGQILWRRHLARDFGAELPTWGYCSAPLIVDDLLVVNPGAPEASLVALDQRTGQTVWKTSGDPPGYASFILAAPHGIRQIIGYDQESAGGWHPGTGARLWRLVPDEPNDFNVTTPIMLGNQLLLSTENNGTRRYAFDASGVLQTKALLQAEVLSPDTSTPVVHQGLVFGNANGLVCLDADTLALNWMVDEEPYTDYCSFIAGNNRLLITTQTGNLVLAQASAQGFKPIDELDLFPDVSDTDRDVWSHPALVGNRLYIRNSLAVYCFLLDERARR